MRGRAPPSRISLYVEFLSEFEGVCASWEVQDKRNASTARKIYIGDLHFKLT